MNRIPTALQLAVAREIDACRDKDKGTDVVTQNRIERIYDNWGSACPDFENADAPCWPGSPLDYQIRKTKIYIYTGGEFLLTRMATLERYLQEFDYNGKNSAEFFFGTLIGIFEAANFLLTELTPAALGSTPNFYAVDKLEMATGDCLLQAMCFNWQRAEAGLPIQIIMSRLSQAMKRYFQQTDDYARRKRHATIDKLIKMSEDIMRGKNLVHPILESFLRELFYCRIHGISLKDMAQLHYAMRLMS